MTGNIHDMNGKKVYVGMSGGVDSSVSAALLQRAGFDVMGVFIKVWQPDWMECSWREDRLDAMRVAAHLGIPLVTLDLEKEYKKEVVDHMISEYKSGRTPNPDVMCNAHVKFGGFFKWAMEQGADFVATGHYARVENSGGTFKLLSGVDQGKDQSYFLYNLTQKELSKTMFPVGFMEKSETRSLAKELSLPVADKKDSQGLCFIGRVDIKEFLSHYIKPNKGKVFNEEGEEIGEHDGAVFLTLGERRGFSVLKKSSDDAPYYVTARDTAKNSVTVAHKSPDGSLSTEKKNHRLESVNWIGSKPPAGKKYKARVRHLGELLPCDVSFEGRGSVIVGFREPVIVASGQSVVIYDGSECLGGGIVS